MSGTANVTATSRTKPKTTETTTDMMMPEGAPRAAFLRLLAHVRRGVVAGERVLGHQQADPEHEPEQRAREARAGEARVVDRLREHEADADWWWSGIDDQDSDDQRDADHVPPGRDRVQQREHAQAEQVDQQVRQR